MRGPTFFFIYVGRQVYYTVSEQTLGMVSGIFWHQDSLASFCGQGDLGDE